MADTITGRGRPYTRRRRAEARAAWVGARGRNTLRRPMRIGAMALSAFVISLVLLIVAPREARRAATRGAPTPSDWRDTVGPLAAIAQSTRAIATADSLLVRRRAVVSRPLTLAPRDTLSPETIARRDSMTGLISELSRLLTRAENAPLSASFRALAEARAIRDDARVRALRDSIVEIERERDEFGTGTGIGVDPIFVSLTTRVTTLGRGIQTIAESTQSSLRAQVNALRPRPPAPTLAPAIAASVADTAGPAARRDSARVRLANAERALATARRLNTETDRRLRAARERANIVAPPMAILGASLVIGLAFGFGATLVGETWNPRVADMHETERVTGARVLAVLRPRAIPHERARRKADRDLPPFLDPTSDAYRLLASHLTPDERAHSSVTVTGDDAVVTAVIAANIAAVAANDARGTLLVDSDLAEAPVSRVLRMLEAPGLSDVMARQLEWAEATRQAVVGRDRPMDVVASGTRRSEPLDRSETERLARELERAARRYDLVVVAAPLAGARKSCPTPDVLLCAHVAHTTLTTLRQSVADLRDRGGRVRGVVLWDAESPELPPTRLTASDPSRDEPDVAEPLARTPAE